MFLTGCGGDNEADKARAREIMLAGDAWMEEVEADFETITSAREEMRDMTTGDEADVDEDEAENLTEDLESTVQSMGESLEEAETAYQAIISLNDAADYKEYADVMLELVAEYEQVLSMQERMQGMRVEGGMPDFEGGPPSEATPPEDWEPPEDMMPPDGSEGNMPRGGFMGDSRIEELKSEAEAIKNEKNL